ncbi:MAG TPA: endo-1,4-beta-xylanase [Polyangiaceae bacterium]
MRRWLCVLGTSLAGFGACAPSAAAPNRPAPPAGAAVTPPGARVSGTSVLGARGLEELALHGETKRVELSLVDVAGQPFSKAFRATVKEKSTNPWDVQLQARTSAKVDEGDVLLATFYFRSEWAPVESGEGQSEFVFELARDPWTKSASFPVKAARAWKKIHVPFVAEASYGPGEAQVIFRLGYDVQAIEIGGLSVESFGKRVALASLPTTKLEYPGMDPGAAWRAAAEARIDQLRKAELVVTVKDETGKLVPRAEVDVRLARHAFGFGTCVPAHLLVGPQADEKFQALVPELFNVVTLENDLKWQPLAGDWGSSYTLERAKAGVAWARERGLAVRGHVLVWPGWRNLPKSLRDFEKDPARLRTEVKRHVRELAGAMKGSLAHWDVVNEPFDNHELLDIVGNDQMISWFEDARAADPAAKLFINDYAILSGGGGTTPHRDHYEKTIAWLVEKGAPLDGVGMQGHFGTSLTGPEDMLKILDRFARFRKPIWITEYDVVIDDAKLAGDFTRDFYTTLFSHPAVGGIVMWGFWDGSHWKSNAPLYGKDWAEKPAGRAYRDLVLGRWRTRASGKTDAKGAFATRGFHGEYEITVTAGARKKATRTVLGPGGSSSVVILD